MLTISRFIFSMLISLALAESGPADFVDNVLDDMSQLASYLGLDPLPVRPFDAVVSSYGAQRKLAVHFTHGSIFGLSNAARIGNCAYASRSIFIAIMYCDVEFSSVQIKMNANVRNTARRKVQQHYITTESSVMYPTHVSLEIEGRVNSTARLRQVSTGGFKIETQISHSSLDLDFDRLQTFIRDVNDNLADQLRRILTTTYFRALRSVVSLHVMP